MLTLHDVVNRTSPPAPWTDGDNIPWDEPEFSKRMLPEHLSQNHDLASRRVDRIDAQVTALLANDIPPAPAKVLDLACGPGLYLSRIAAAGHECVGIDFSPASIEYAANQGSDIDYRLSDLRTAEFDTGHDTVLLLYGQLNVFRRHEARSILARAFSALEPGGRLVVEPQTFAHVRSTGDGPPTWSSHESGLFSADPHLLLTESFWDDTTCTTTQRFYVVHARTGSVVRHALSTEAYSEEQLTDMLKTAGFGQIEHRPSVTGKPHDDGLEAVVGVRTV